ncbi:hypothetical protein BDR26DRAFT_1004376 [Obelidium mucronatum]|nr:hypothetical protein BDR26DRAFT_1004376 [Obelidium mucronatum]
MDPPPHDMLNQEEQQAPVVTMDTDDLKQSQFIQREQDPQTAPHQTQPFTLPLAAEGVLLLPPPPTSLLVSLPNTLPSSPAVTHSRQRGDESSRSDQMHSSDALSYRASEVTPEHSNKPSFGFQNNSYSQQQQQHHLMSPPPHSAFSSSSARSPRNPNAVSSFPPGYESRELNRSPADRMHIDDSSPQYQQKSHAFDNEVTDVSPLIHNDRAAPIDLYDAYGGSEVGATTTTRPDSAASRDDGHIADDRYVNSQSRPHDSQSSSSGSNRYENDRSSGGRDVRDGGREPVRDRSRGPGYSSNRNDGSGRNPIAAISSSNNRDFNNRQPPPPVQSHQQPRGTSISSSVRDSRDSRDARDARDIRDVRDSRDSRDGRETRDGRDTRGDIRQEDRRPLERPSDRAGDRTVDRSSDYRTATQREGGSVRGVSRSPPPPVNRRKRDEEDEARYGSKRSKMEESDLKQRGTTGLSTRDGQSGVSGSGSSHTRSSNRSSEKDESVNAILKLCDNPEKLDKALESVKALLSAAPSEDKRLTANEQISVIRKVMVAACRARRVRIAQQAYELIIDLRASFEPSSADLVELLSMYVATGKAELMSEMLATVKPNLTLSNVAVLWQTALVGPTKGRSILVALTKLLLGVMDKNSPSNEFFGIVVLELIAANLSDWIEKILIKLNVGNVPSRSSYHSQMAPRTSIPLKRGILVAVIQYFIRIRNSGGAFDCLKYMYDVGYAFHEESLFGVFKMVLTGNELDVVDEVFKMIKSVSGLYLSNPLLFDEALAVACSNDKVSTAIDIVEHMAQTKTRPSMWSSILPVMRLASSLDMLQKFVGVFNVFFTTEGEGSSAPHSDMDPVLISELVTNCVAHGMFTHAFWYFKYMSHANIPRTHEAYRSLIFALEQDSRGLKAESQGLWTDIGSNQYPVSGDQIATIFKALLAHGGLDAKKSALEIYDNISGSDKKTLITSVNPNALLDFIFYFDRDNEGFALFEDLCDADPTWPATLTDNVSILLFQKGGDQGRFDVLQLVVDRLRASGQTVPNRQLVRNLIGCLASVRSTDPHRVLLATQIYIWGVKAGTSGYIKTKELSNLNLRLEECWCLLDIRLHLLRCLEWMHREVPKNQINGDLKVFLPPVCSVLNSNPSGNAIVKLKGPVLANCVKYEIKAWFSGKLEVRVETDERDRDGSKSFLILTKQSVLDWMAYNFGPTFESDSVFNCMPEIRDKDFEGGSLLFSKDTYQERKPEYRRNDNANVGGSGAGSGVNRNNNPRLDTQFSSRSGGATGGHNVIVPASSSSFDRGARHFKRDDTGRRERRDDYRAPSGNSGYYESTNSSAGGGNGRDVPSRSLDEPYGDAPVLMDRGYDDSYEFQASRSSNHDNASSSGDYSQYDDKRRSGSRH